MLRRLHDPRAGPGSRPGRWEAAAASTRAWLQPVPVPRKRCQATGAITSCTARTSHGISFGPRRATLTRPPFTT
ncbi:hypothetical protein R2601_04338 [Salipiger bermudensis HTCC2601]|uniref:Uncharacterized protein n=1 Tax=Salipiger bermudensis (strain DSM 26914 / JCM 13377 / KCTC 12554 / HTCC2601) TaxID=314265 RepID=Q0FVX8_SALBH|nr:hypothetical protein R2601_04338 [Salipiger bermudensis HTCC2601]